MILISSPSSLYYQLVQTVVNVILYSAPALPFQSFQDVRVIDIFTAVFEDHVSLLILLLNLITSTPSWRNVSINARISKEVQQQIDDAFSQD
jgi:hypothetical protein